MSTRGCVNRELASKESGEGTNVVVAIEFFPGRVKRDEWAKQAGEILRD